MSGNDFAVGVGRINLAATLSPEYVNIPPVSAQVSDFLARGAVDPGALYALSGGHNDVITQFEGVLGGTITPAAAQAAIVTAANAPVAQVARMQSAGVRHLIVVGITNISGTQRRFHACPSRHGAGAVLSRRRGRSGHRWAGRSRARWRSVLFSRECFHSVRVTSEKMKVLIIHSPPHAEEPGKAIRQPNPGE